jgi:hypothetical protein
MSRQTPRFSGAASRRSRAAAPRPSRRRHLYIHGGFTGTDAKFSFCFPPEEEYQGRFFQATHQLLAGEEATPRSIALHFRTTRRVRIGSRFDARVPAPDWVTDPTLCAIWRLRR